MARSDGPQRWPAAMACSDGLQRWPAAMACSDGPQQWPAAMACSDGLQRGSGVLSSCAATHCPAAAAAAAADPEPNPPLLYRCRCWPQAWACPVCRDPSAAATRHYGAGTSATADTSLPTHSPAARLSCHPLSRWRRASACAMQHRCLRLLTPGCTPASTAGAAGAGEALKVPWLRGQGSFGGERCWGEERRSAD